jgi:serine phosphatase RsbU (regulator of sigma subunit)
MIVITYNTNMKRTERLAGIISISLFCLGILFKMQHIPFSGLMILLSVLLLNLIYLPIHLILQYRASGSLLERIYSLLQFVTLFCAVFGMAFKIQHWAGAGILYILSNVLIPILIASYFILRASRKGKLPFILNDLVIALLCYFMFIFVQKNTVSRSVLEGYFLITEHYQKLNAGIESSNTLIYQSTDSLIQSENQGVRESIRMAGKASREVHRRFDSIFNEFSLFCTGYPLDELMERPYILSEIGANGNLGDEFFESGSNGKLLKESLGTFMEDINRIAGKNDIQSALIGFGLDTADTRDVYGDALSWESIFGFLPVSAIFSYSAWLKNMILLTESTMLHELIGRLDQSGETELIRDMARRESERAIESKEDELLMIKQQQELFDLKLAQSGAELQQQRTISIFAFTGIGFVLLMLIVSTRAYARKQKDNKILVAQKNEISDKNEELNQQNEEILAQRDEIEAQRDLLFSQKQQIEKTHHEISSSIDYATRLQSAVLPDTGLLNEHLADHFVFFRPRDKVSGDFYWWTEVEGQIIIAAADCTGHGVPGAFMSMLGISLLREIVNKEYITHPGVILRKLRKEIIRSLKQKGVEGEQKDGMDVSLISINPEKTLCQYAGANNPFYIIRKGELIEFRPDRMPIAIYQRMDKFTMHEIPLHEGDQLYLFSDGVADQFGGPRGKKMKYKGFQQLLLDISVLGMSGQEKALTDYISNWMGSLEQVDDMIVIGLKI